MAPKRGKQDGSLLPRKKRKTIVESEDDDAATGVGLVATELVDRPHSVTLHALKDIEDLRSKLSEWFDRVQDVRGMPWRKPFSAAPELQAQRAYEVTFI